MMRFVLASLADDGVRSDRMYVSMERNMQCGIGLCGHCQLGPKLLCRDGPVCRWSEIAPWLSVREL
jgi:NAD(P)H-flavin reductase